MKKSFLGCVMAAALCFAPSLVAAGAPEVKLGAGYVGMSIDVKTVRGVVFLFAEAREFGGKVAVCGLVYFENPTATLKVMEPKITSKIDYSISGKRLTVNTSMFNRFKTEADAKAGTARCSMTTAAWKAAYGNAKLAINLARGSVSE